VTLAEVLAQPFIGREPDSATRVSTESQLQARGIVLPVAMEVGSNEAIKQMVRVGLGLAMVSETTIQTEVTAGTLIALPIPELEIVRRSSLLQAVGCDVGPTSQRIKIEGHQAGAVVDGGACSGMPVMLCGR
jgi:DNA-binding transcriptional LysR family regulator